jgi:hypothetical protein
MFHVHRCALAAVAVLCLTSGSLRANPVPPGERFPARVLLFGAAAGRDFQFLRSLLLREHAAKKIGRVALCLPGVRQHPIPAAPDPLDLKQFPARFEQPGEKEQPDPEKNLAAYDVLVAFDPDWKALQAAQQEALARWVRAGGGLIVVAGPIHTPQLAVAAHRKALTPVLELLPVTPQDSRLFALEQTGEKPARLNFTAAAEKEGFLKLDADSKKPLAGWAEFFDKEKDPVRGFYNCSPVKDAKPGAVVLAAFAAPNLAKGQAEPVFLATRRVEKGRVVWVGSAELWRLRAWREAAHERLWLGLIDHARGR